MSWFIVMQQNGGCDYSIGCGIKIIRISGNSLEEATIAAKNFFLSEDGSYYLTSDESKISEACLVESNDEELPIHQWRGELNARKIEKEKKLQEAKELAELERLKKKYGK